jgi:FMN phosphatase YigB (HAD superfamily)
MKPTLICFDWGGVIIRICRSFKEGCEHAGIEYRSEADTPEMREARRAHSRPYQRGAFPPEEYFRRLAEACDSIYTSGEIADIHRAWLLGDYPGVGELIDRLNALEGIETGMLSNTCADHWARQFEGADGSPPEFPGASRLLHRHASHLMGVDKPDPLIFRRFEQLTGHEAGRILFFEDTPENVEAARSAGWMAELIDHEGDTPAQMARHLASHGVF